MFSIWLERVRTTVGRAETTWLRSESALVNVDSKIRAHRTIARSNSRVGQQPNRTDTHTIDHKRTHQALFTGTTLYTPECERDSAFSQMVGVSRWLDALFFTHGVPKPINQRRTLIAGCTRTHDDDLPTVCQMSQQPSSRFIRFFSNAERTSIANVNCGLAIWIGLMRVLKCGSLDGKDGVLSHTHRETGNERTFE